MEAGRSASESSERETWQDDKASKDFGDLEQKQAMLRVELLEQGYDGEDFVKYIAEDLEGKSLEEWTLDELKEVCHTHPESNRVQEAHRPSQKLRKRC